MNAVVKHNSKPSQVAAMAARFGIDPAIMIPTLKATAFRGDVSDAQMVALVIVANQYGLNPWTREIYAFPDRNNGIVPVIGVDGWSRIINEHPQFDGMDFEQDDESCVCVIHRKDRGHPIRVMEYMAECNRATPPWKSHPRRMLRHKAMIQCARLAFGFVGVYDPDEAERIMEANIVKRAPAAASQTLRDKVLARTAIADERAETVQHDAEPVTDKPLARDPDTGEVLPAEYQ